MLRVPGSSLLRSFLVLVQCGEPGCQKTTSPSPARFLLVYFTKRAGQGQIGAAAGAFAGQFKYEGVGNSGAAAVLTKAVILC